MTRTSPPKHHLQIKNAFQEPRRRWHNRGPAGIKCLLQSDGPGNRMGKKTAGVSQMKVAGPTQHLRPWRWQLRAGRARSRQGDCSLSLPLPWLSTHLAVARTSLKEEGAEVGDHLEPPPFLSQASEQANSPKPSTRRPPPQSPHQSESAEDPRRWRPDRDAPETQAKRAPRAAREPFRTPGRGGGGGAETDEKRPELCRGRGERPPGWGEPRPGWGRLPYSTPPARNSSPMLKLVHFFCRW